MKIAVASDHAGYEEPKPYYKPAIMDHLKQLGHEVVDCGTNSPEAVDYPDHADALCKAILNGEAECGVLMCGTGIGVSIAANRHKGIRAAVCTSEEMARLSRQHNNSNVICLGRRTATLDQCLALIDVWLATDFSGAERHVRRVAKMG